MTTLQKAIEKAIEGGFKGLRANKYEYFLDPLFWQSLGKAMGWKEKGDTSKPFFGKIQTGDVGLQIIQVEEYLYQWHRLIDHLAKGGTAESFFETLIPPEEKLK